MTMPDDFNPNLPSPFEIHCPECGWDGGASDEAELNRLRRRVEDLTAALTEMLFNFKRPHRDEWLNEAGFERAINACAAAERALVERGP